MGGGLMQLVAYGAQDIYLTGNPQITFFKVVYRRHTNFAMESIEQSFSGSTDFGGTVSAVISRSGDLIGRTYVRIITPAFTPTPTKNFRWLNWLGHVLVKEVKLEIGGQEIDKQYGEWFHIWNELSQQPGQQANYAEMVGNVPKYVQPSTSSKPSREIYVPLQFFYCRNPGLALPLIALQYHEVKITVTFRTATECYWSENITETIPSISASLWIDYIFLDTDERRRFAQKSHEYLIEQLQSTTESIQATANRINLPFNHPVKELVWVIQKDAHVNNTLMQPVGGMQWFNYTDRVDTTNFTGTPAHPSGGGLGGSAHVGLYPYASMPMGGATYAPNSGVFAGTSYRAPAAFDMNTAPDINLQSLSFFDLFGNGNDSGVNFATANEAIAYNSRLPVFDVGENPTLDAKLLLNGTDRFTTRTGFYFNHVQPYQHHTNGPAPGICVYSFALTPEEHQPSGTCNFSRIDTATLQINTTTYTLKAEDGVTATTAKIRIFATNYNVLRIMSGMGGLAYSN